jgi:hypothetical protein
LVDAGCCCECTGCANTAQIVRADRSQENFFGMAFLLNSYAL